MPLFVVKAIMLVGLMHAMGAFTGHQSIAAPIVREAPSPYAVASSQPVARADDADCALARVVPKTIGYQGNTARLAQEPIPPYASR